MYLLYSSKHISVCQRKWGRVIRLCFESSMHSSPLVKHLAKKKLDESKYKIIWTFIEGKDDTDFEKHGKDSRLSALISFKLILIHPLLPFARKYVHIYNAHNCSYKKIIDHYYLHIYKNNSR